MFCIALHIGHQPFRCIAFLSRAHVRDLVITGVKHNVGYICLSQFASENTMFHNMAYMNVTYIMKILCPLRLVHIYSQDQTVNSQLIWNMWINTMSEGALDSDLSWKKSSSQIYTLYVYKTIIYNPWCVYVSASLHMRREEKPTICHLMVYCTYNMLNIL